MKSRSHVVPLVVVALALLATFLPAASAAAAAAQVGFKDQSFTGASEAPSASKPESKVWFNDGIWWGEMWSSSAAAFRIFRLNGSTWVDTGTTVDNRGSTRADTLWTGSKLYIATHDVASDSSHNTPNRPARLDRFSYNSSTDTYSLDAGFPATITTVSTETLVIDRDSTGMLWATWTEGRAVKVAHTVGSDTTWSAGMTLPGTGTSSLNSDDISSLIAFGGNRIGVMWSNQSQSHMYFATHRDGDPDTTWSTSEAATSGSGSADDHINLKTDSAGRVYAAVKTSFTSSSATLTQLLVRSTAGTWVARRFGTVAESNTRPIVEIDEAAGVIHMYATGPYPGSGSGQSGGTIYEKTSPMSSISFASGTGTAVIQDPSSADMNNASSTKQNVSSSTGLVVIATNDSRKVYWHSLQTLGGGGGGNTPPTANAVSRSVPFQTPTVVNLSGSDPETCQLTFAIVTPPAHGSLGSITNNACTAGSPNTDAATVVYTPATTYSGMDSFRYTVSDGTATSVPATATLTVASGGGGGGGDTTLTLNPIADSYVSTSNLTGNYGTATTMKVREGAGDATSPNYRTYLKFDVSGVGSSVSAVQLKLFVTDASANLESVYLVGDSSWGETTITYANAPAITGTAIGTTQAAPVGAYVTITLDPTTFPTGTSTLTLAIKSSATDSFVVSSREDPTNKPQLVVTSH